MKRALLLVLLSAAPVCAQQTSPASETPTVPAPPVVIEIPAPTVTTSPPTLPTTATPSFLSSRGTLTSQELIDALNAKLTPQQRTQLDQAVAKRNAALSKANDELNMTLRDLLRETDEGLTRRIDDEAEAKRMERMRRLQPGRYQHLMKKKQAEEKKAKNQSK